MERELAPSSIRRGVLRRCYRGPEWPPSVRETPVQFGTRVSRNPHIEPLAASGRITTTHNIVVSGT